MEQEKLTQEILQGMLLSAFEKIGGEILKKHPEFASEEMKTEATRLTSIYMENYDRETNSFDMEMIKRISGIDFPGE